MKTQKIKIKSIGINSVDFKRTYSIFVIFAGICLSLYVFGVLKYINNTSHINALEREITTLQEEYSSIIISQRKDFSIHKNFSTIKEEIIVSENKRAYALRR